MIKMRAPAVGSDIEGVDAHRRAAWLGTERGAVYAARVALFGRKINLAESPLDIVRLMRAVADGATTPSEAVKDYHAALEKQGLKPTREIAIDSTITESVLKSG